MLRRTANGFTLTELAVVLAIVALLMSGAIATLSLQTDLRNHDETLRRLNAAADAVVAFAIVNRRLPCPASPTSSGVESPAGGTCSNSFDGLLPAQSIGFTPVDASSFGVDVWGNRIRYAVASAITGCTGTPATPHFTSAANLKANGVSCRPSDLEVWNGFDACIAGATPATSSCTGARTVTRVAAAETAAFVIYSTGKNGAIASDQGADELANTNGDKVFVYRTPSDSSSSLGTYDDLMVIVPAGVLYAKLIAAGVLP